MCPVNMLGNSLFKQCTVLFNDKQVSNGAQLFQHTSYLETLLSYDKAAKDTILKAAMYYEDTEAYFHDLEFNVDAPHHNVGGRTRLLKCIQSSVVEMLINLHSPVFNMNTLLPGNVKINIKLTR